MKGLTRSLAVVSALLLAASIVCVGADIRVAVLPCFFLGSIAAGVAIGLHLRAITSPSRPETDADDKTGEPASEHDR